MQVTWNKKALTQLFKLVYYVKDDILHIAALWDTRREPAAQADNQK